MLSSIISSSGSGLIPSSLLALLSSRRLARVRRRGAMTRCGVPSSLATSSLWEPIRNDVAAVVLGPGPRLTFKSPLLLLHPSTRPDLLNDTTSVEPWVLKYQLSPSNPWSSELVESGGPWIRVMVASRSPREKCRRSDTLLALFAHRGLSCLGTWGKGLISRKAGCEREGVSFFGNRPRFARGPVTADVYWSAHRDGGGQQGSCGLLWACVGDRVYCGPAMEAGVEFDNLRSS